MIDLQEEDRYKAEAAVKQKFGLKTRITRSEGEARKYWAVRRESFNLLRQHTRGRQSAPFVDDLIVHPADLPEFLPELDKIFARYPSLIYTIAGHPGNGNFHIIPLVKLSDPETRRIIPIVTEEIYQLVFKYHGSITA